MNIFMARSVKLLGYDVQEKKSSHAICYRVSLCVHFKEIIMYKFFVYLLVFLSPTFCAMHRTSTLTPIFTSGMIMKSTNYYMPYRSIWEYMLLGILWGKWMDEPSKCYSPTTITIRPLREDDDRLKLIIKLFDNDLKKFSPQELLSAQYSLKRQLAEAEIQRSHNRVSERVFLSIKDEFEKKIKKIDEKFKHNIVSK